MVNDPQVYITLALQSQQYTTYNSHTVLIVYTFLTHAYTYLSHHDHSLTGSSKFIWRLLQTLD